MLIFTTSLKPRPTWVWGLFLTLILAGLAVIVDSDVFSADCRNLHTALVISISVTFPPVFLGFLENLIWSNNPSCYKDSSTTSRWSCIDKFWIAFWILSVIMFPMYGFFCLVLGVIDIHWGWLGLIGVYRLSRL